MNAEELKFSDLKTEVECDHIKGGYVPKGTSHYYLMDFRFCPECGEKL